MKRLLKETCAKLSASETKQLTEREYRKLRKRYRIILTHGAKEMPAIPIRTQGKRSRIAKSDAHNLWERLKKHEPALLRFHKQSSIPLTNNLAERDLRMSTMKQKGIIYLTPDNGAVRSGMVKCF